ncbi:Immunoglobulin superfamily member 22 [Bienertia sinuspersici]
MGIWASKEPPPPMVLVPPLFDFPPLGARIRMLESSYNLLFGKLALKCLFEDYFDEARQYSTRILLKPLDDPHVDIIATFRWQSDVHDPHTFADLFVANTDPVLRIRSSAYYPKYGVGAFGIIPLISKRRVIPDDYGVMGLRYGSGNLSLGLTVTPFPKSDIFPRTAWLVSKYGRLTAGLQYEPLYSTKDDSKLINPKDWSCAVGYGLGSGSPLSPSFNFGLELANSSQFVASFYQHLVVQRKVQNPFEENDIIGITNYLDFGFELKTRLDDNSTTDKSPDSTFQIAASWQANKNFLLKGKAGPRGSTLALAFKSWWKPAFTFSISATNDHTAGNTSFGFGLRVENLREASYERADPNFVMLTPSKEHVAESLLWNDRKSQFYQSDLSSGNFDGLPKELRPLGKIL